MEREQPEYLINYLQDNKINLKGKFKVSDWDFRN
jgi:hypothetical protein